VKRILLYIVLVLFCLTVSSGAWFMGPGMDPGFTKPPGAGHPLGDGLLLESVNYVLLETGDFLLLE
jgi:hypothetical protein